MAYNDFGSAKSTYLLGFVKRLSTNDPWSFRCNKKVLGVPRIRNVHDKRKTKQCITIMVVCATVRRIEKQ